MSAVRVDHDELLTATPGRVAVARLSADGEPPEWSRLLGKHRLAARPPRPLPGEQPCPGIAASTPERREPANAGRSATWTRWA